MAEQFDAYYKWLGIPPKDQPPNHYRLLGVELFEDNADVIETAAERQATYLHEVSTGPHVKESQKLLNEIAAARLCLLDPEKKAAYDAELKSKATANVTVDALPGGDSGIDDLPWDDLEPLMNNGSSSDTVPKNQATSETMPLRSDSSGVFSAPASLAGSGVHPAQPTEAKPPNRTLLWSAIGGGVALVLVVTVVAVVLATRGGDDESQIVKQSQDQDSTTTNSTNLNGPPDNGEKKQPDKVEPDKKQPDKVEQDKKQPDKVEPDQKQPVKVEPDKKQPDKKNANDTPRKNGGNDNNVPDKSGNGTKVGSTPKNGSSSTAEVRERRMKPDEFRTLKPFEVISGTGTTTFTVLDDKSVLALGGSVDDQYEIQLETDVSDITAIKLEALPHKDLDFHGPGHGAKGGFAFIEVRVLAAPADKPADKELIALSGVESNEAPSVIERTIDGKDVGFWPVRRGGEKTSFTMFMKDAIWHEDGSILYVQLIQREKLGHFRVAVSNAEELEGKRTRIEADLPLFVNLGGNGGIDAAKREWQASRPFDGGAFGYVGGQPEGRAAGDPLGSCISGIQEFRVTLPEGKYDVFLYFSGRFPQGMSQREFHITAPGAKKQTVKNLPARESFVTRKLEGAEAKDGGLTITFEAAKGDAVLNAIGIDKAK